jgi:hypothetical protein
VPPTDIDDDLDALLHAENPGNLSDSIIEFPRQVLDAMAAATDDELVAQLRTADGDVLEDVDLRDVAIEKTAASGRFLVRVGGAAVVVTGGALIAAAMHLRHKRHVKRT